MPHISWMSSSITLFLLFSTFLIIYLPFFIKKTRSLDALPLLDTRDRRTTRTPSARRWVGLPERRQSASPRELLPACQRGGLLPKDTLYFGSQIMFSEVCPPTAQRCLRPRHALSSLPKRSNSNFLPRMMF